MNQALVKEHYLLLVYAKAVYDNKNGFTLKKKFVPSHFARFVNKTLVDNGMNASLIFTSIENSFTRFKKNDFNDLNGDTKGLVHTLASFCGFENYKSFKSAGIKVEEDLELEESYLLIIQYLLNDKKIRFKSYRDILLSMKIDISQEIKISTIIRTPKNWLKPEVCKNLEIHTPRIIVSVITSNMNWASKYKDEILNSAIKNDSFYRYIVTGTEGYTEMYNLLDLVEEEKLEDQIYAIKIDDPIEYPKPKYGFKEKDMLIFRPVGTVVFPLPNDIVVYSNIPQDIGITEDLLFKDKYGRNSMAVLGIQPYDRNMEGLDYYDICIDPKKGKSILLWFNNVWEMITGRKYPKYNDKSK